MIKFFPRLNPALICVLALPVSVYARQQQAADDEPTKPVISLKPSGTF